MRSSILILFVLAVSAVTAFNHYTTQSYLRYFEDVQVRDTRELTRIKATEDAQIMATEALVVARVQAQQVEELTARLHETEQYAIRVIQAQNEYIAVLLATLAANGIEPPSPK